MQCLKWSITFTLALALSVILFVSPLAHSTQVAGNQEIFGDYYAFLAEISSAPLEQQTKKLKSYIQSHPSFERPYHQLLTLYLEMNQIEKAERFFKQNLALPAHERNSLWALASLAGARDSIDVAVARLEKALELYTTPYLLMEYASYFQRHSERRQFHEKLNELQIAPNDKRIAQVFYYSSLGDFETCQFLLDSIKIDEDFSLYARHISAYVQSFGKNVEEAKSLFQAGLEDAKKNGDEQFYIHYLLSFSRQVAPTNLRLSLKYCNEALEKAERVNDLDRIILAHETFGDIYLNHNKNMPALNHAKTAYELASRQHHSESAAKAFYTLGKIYVNLSRHAEALAYFNKSEEIAAKANDIVRQILAIRGRGDFYLGLNLYDLAAYELFKAIRLANSVNNPVYYNETIIILAAGLYEQNNFEQSKELLNSAIASGHLDIVYTAYAYFQLAMCYEVEGNLPQALTTYNKVCEVAQVDLENAWLRYFMALSLPQRALLESHFGNHAKADSLLNDPIIQEIMNNRSSMQIDYYSSRGRVYLNQRDFDNAVDNYSVAAQLVDDFQDSVRIEQFRIGYYGQTSDVYHSLTESYYRRHQHKNDPADIANIFNSLQKCSGRTLQELASVRAQTDYSSDYRKTIENLHYLQRHLRDSVWKKDSSMTAELRIQHDVARYSLLNQRGLVMNRAARSKPKDVSLRELQNVCGENNFNVLFYHISDSLSFSFIVQPDTALLVPLTVPKDSLKAYIYQLMAPLHDASSEHLDTIQFQAEVAHSLYNAVVEPLKARTTLSEHLVIVPGTALLNLPFEILLTQPPQRKSYTPGDTADYADSFLQIEHSFTYLPSLAPLFGKPKKAGSLIVFSNPKFYLDEQVFASVSGVRSALRSMFMPLPYADMEADSILEITKADHVYGKDVTKPAVLKAMQKYDIVHIATHAFVDSVFDAYSGIVLATANEQDDGLLMGYELQDILIHNDLIVLSACESGGGQFVAGEGVLGLPRLFLRAGAKSVLMSLWKVHDPFPMHLMPTFYDNYINHQKSKTEALALAKRHILTSSEESLAYYKHPFYWATFCLYGDPGLAEKQDVSFSFLWIIGAALLLTGGIWSFYALKTKRA